MTTAADSFKIDGPAVISFSGGRTSGYMLWHILQAHGGTLPDDVVPVFCNTGKEVEQTLEFVKACGEQWDVNIVWVEFDLAERTRDRWREVTFETASRKGEPFEKLLSIRAMLPNVVARFCTADLKIKVMGAYAKSRGWGNDFTNVLGLRADEPGRVSRMRSGRNTPWDNTMPLAAAGVTKQDVQAFWSRQNFDLRLPNIGGVTPAGNCDLCFLKSAVTIQGLIRSNPALADWWIEQEAKAKARGGKPNGQVFRSDRPGYAAMKEAVLAQHTFDFGDADHLVDCFCGEGA